MEKELNKKSLLFGFFVILLLFSLLIIFNNKEVSAVGQTSFCCEGAHADNGVDIAFE